MAYQSRISIPDQSRLSVRSEPSVKARCLGWLLCSAIGGYSPTAFAQADDVKACAEAYEQAQVTRNSGKLKESEEQLRVCVRDACPDFVKVDCGQWLSDVRREMPSVILMVTDGSGNEVTDVQVAIDGVAVAQSLDGKALEVNPGPHDITFEREGAKRSERVSIRQGEKNRVIKIELTQHSDSDGDGVEDATDRCPTEAGVAVNFGCPQAAPKTQPREGLSSLEVGAIVAGGVGVLGFATFGVFGTMSRVNANAAFAECGEDGHKCDNSKIQDYRDKEALYNPVANVGAIVGGVGVATAVALFALSLEDPSTSEQSGSVGFSVSPTQGGAWVSAHTRF